MTIRTRTLPDGSRRYDVEVRVESRNGQGRKKKVTRTVRTKQQALTLEAELKGEARRGGVRNGRITVGQLLDQWVEFHSHGDGAWSANTRYGYIRIIERDLRPAVGAKKLDRLTGKDLDDLYVAMKRRGVASGTIHNTHSCIRAALNQAKKWKLVPYNVAEDATPGPVWRHDGAIATDAEVDQLMAAIARIESEAQEVDRGCVLDGCDGRHYGRGFCLPHWKEWRYRGHHDHLALPTQRGSRPRGLRAGGIHKIKLAVLVASETGMRRGELAGLDWSDFDWRNNTVTVRRAKADAGGNVTDQSTKTHATRTIPLAPDAVTVLKRYRGIGSVFGMSPRQLSDWFDYLCEEAGIEPLEDAGDGRKRRQKKIGWHSFRHRLLTDLGAVTDIKTVAAIGGHGSLRTTEKYMHARQERAVAAIEARARRRSLGVPSGEEVIR